MTCSPARQVSLCLSVQEDVKISSATQGIQPDEKETYQFLICLLALQEDVKILVAEREMALHAYVPKAAFHIGRSPLHAYHHFSP